MKKSAAIRHFKTGAALARAMGITRQTVCEWPEIIPDPWAYKVFVKSDFKVPLAESDYRDGRRPKCR